MVCWCPSGCQPSTWRTRLTRSPRYNHVQFMLNPFSISHLQIANKAIKLFTTWKLDLTPHVKEVKETLAQIYEKQVNLTSYVPIDICLSLCPSYGNQNCKKTFSGKGEQIWEAIWQGEEDIIGQNSWRRICQSYSGNYQKTCNHNCISVLRPQSFITVHLSRLCGKHISMCLMAGLSVKSTFSAWSTTGDTQTFPS